MHTLTAPLRLVQSQLPALPCPTGSATVLVLTPRHLSDGATVLQAVREDTSVVVNSSWLEDGSGQRLIDFVCGGLEAIGGTAHRIDDEVFLFTPGRAQVTGPHTRRPRPPASARRHRASP